MTGPEPADPSAPPGRPDHGHPAGPTQPARPARPTKAELDRIFGTDDPVSTRDDLPDPEIPAGRDAAESWYLENRPPHHG